MNSAVSDVAGPLQNSKNAQRAFEAFRGSRSDWKAYFEPKILDGIAINEGDLAQFPRFVWADEDASVNRAELARRLLQVAVPALLLAALGAWRLRRYAIV